MIKRLSNGLVPGAFRVLHGSLGCSHLGEPFLALGCGVSRVAWHLLCMHSTYGRCLNSVCQAHTEMSPRDDLDHKGLTAKLAKYTGGPAGLIGNAQGCFATVVTVECRTLCETGDR